MRVDRADAGLVDPDPLLPWLNRASDLLFVLARASERAPRPSKTVGATAARQMGRTKARRAKR